MAFTKIAAAGIGSTGTVTLQNIIVTGSVNTPSITGAASTENVKTNSLVVSGVTTSSGGFVGNVTGNATGLSGTPNITVGSIIASSATISGNVSVAGTVTYEDVTNVDSVGVVTARSGVVINSGGLQVTGVTTVAAGSTSAPSISPTGDSNTGIFFPSADTIAFAEGGAEALRIDSSSNIGIGSTGTLNTRVYVRTSAISQTPLKIDFNSESYSTGSGSQYSFFPAGLSLNISNINAVSSAANLIYLETQGLGGYNGSYIGAVDAGGSSGSNNIVFGARTGATTWAERVRIDSSGKLMIGSSNATSGLSVLTYGTQLGYGGNTYPFPAGRNFIQFGNVTNGTDNWVGFTADYGNTSGSCNIMLQAAFNNINQQSGAYIGAQVTGLAANALTFGHLNAPSTVGGNSTKVERLRIDSSGNTLPGADNSYTCGSSSYRWSVIWGRQIIGNGYGSLGDYGGLFGQIRVGADQYGNTIKAVNDTNLNITANNAIYFNTGAATNGTDAGTTRAYVSSTGFLPNSDNTYDLGSSSLRWRNIYTADLQMSNEGSQNDIDGTWGKYTIQEGENDLFLINRRTGKKYKFLLEEVK